MHSFVHCSLYFFLALARVQFGSVLSHSWLHMWDESCNSCCCWLSCNSRPPSPLPSLLSPFPFTCFLFLSSSTQACAPFVALQSKILRHSHFLILNGSTKVCFDRHCALERRGHFKKEPKSTLFESTWLYFFLLSLFHPALWSLFCCFGAIRLCGSCSAC